MGVLRLAAARGCAVLSDNLAYCAVPCCHAATVGEGGEASQAARPASPFAAASQEATDWSAQPAAPATEPAPAGEQRGRQSAILIWADNQPGWHPVPALCAQ
jgi:hypothetical protein